MIQITGMTKFYQMGDTVVHALDGVDLTIQRGEFVSITGASGSGKSTIMHLIGCLDRPTSGYYILDNQRIDQVNDHRLASLRNEYIGFVFQTFNLINRTNAIENVALPMVYARKSGSRKLATRALERVGLGPRARHKPIEMSGGERQRVAIARALVNDPPLILADEPTGNLDSRTGNQIMDIFHDLHQSGVTVILVTHEMAVAAQAQRVVRMSDGKIIEDRLVDEAFREQLLAERMQADSKKPRSGSVPIARPITPPAPEPDQE